MKNNTKIFNFLISQFGINRATALKIFLKIGLHETAIFANCTSRQKTVLKELMDDLKLHIIKKRQVYNIKKLQTIFCYRGYRHSHGLPVNGQRTHTNAKTQKRLLLNILKKQKKPVAVLSQKKI